MLILPSGVVGGDGVSMERAEKKENACFKGVLESHGVF